MLEEARGGGHENRIMELLDLNHDFAGLPSRFMEQAYLTLENSHQSPEESQLPEYQVFRRRGI
jgi:hypothetical protein